MGVNAVEYFGETLIDISKDTVSPQTMFFGETAHDKNGDPIVGAVMTMRGTVEQNSEGVAIMVPYSEFGDAKPDDVINSQTFTSESGLKQQGTLPIQYGSQTIQVTPKMGYGIGPCVMMSAEPLTKVAMIPGTSYIDLVSPFSSFGDALCEHVKKGKVFTSEAGFQAVGTAEDNVSPTLYGSYLLKENPNDIYISDEEYWEIEQNFQGYRVYGYFYDDGWHREGIQKIFGDPAIQIQSVNGKTINQYDGYWYYDDDMANYFPDDRFRVIDFCEPVEVTNEFYRLFLEMVDVYYEDSPFIRGEEIGYNGGFRDGYSEGYDEGYYYGNDEGYAEGYADGYTDGATNVSSGYDEFWDAFQDYGNRINYDYGFAGKGWNENTFKPKYDIRPRAASRIFSATDITDLKQLLEDNNVVFDFSNCTTCSYFAENKSRLTRVPTLDTRSLANLTYFFYDCPDLYYIEKIILKSDGSQGFGNYTFNNLPSLVEIRFEGVIGKGGLNMQWSKSLSKASIYSIINALSTTTSGLSVTLSLTAVSTAFMDGAVIGYNSDEWKNLISTRPNWTINLE